MASVISAVQKHPTAVFIPVPSLFLTFLIVETISAYKIILAIIEQ